MGYFDYSSAVQRISTSPAKSYFKCLVPVVFIIKLFLIYLLTIRRLCAYLPSAGFTCSESPLCDSLPVRFRKPVMDLLTISFHNRKEVSQKT